jgi:hypothetical protein
MKKQIKKKLFKKCRFEKKENQIWHNKKEKNQIIRDKIEKQFQLRKR